VEATGVEGKRGDGPRALVSGAAIRVQLEWKPVRVHPDVEVRRGPFTQDHRDHRDG